MCLAIKEMREESMQQGEQQGVELLAEAIRLLRDGVTETELRTDGKYSDAVIQNAVMLK